MIQISELISISYEFANFSCRHEQLAVKAEDLDEDVINQLCRYPVWRILPVNDKSEAVDVARCSLSFGKKRFYLKVVLNIKRNLCRYTENF